MHLIVAFAAFVALSTALYTPKGSSCTIECGTAAQNFTGTGDLVCLDTAYDDTTKGVLLKQCVKCLSASTYVNAASYNGNSDQYWYLCMLPPHTLLLTTDNNQGISNTFSNTALSTHLKLRPQRIVPPNVMACTTP